MIKNNIKNFVGMVRGRWFQIVQGRNVYIGKHCNFQGKGHIVLGNSVTVRPYAQIWGGGTVTIADGCEIGERCRISIANSLEMGEKVLISPNVYITDCDHEYSDVSVPVIDQGIKQRGQRVSIGKGSFIGINVVIIGNVKIGRHCVIGANSVVTRDIPEYSVAVGNPSRVIKSI